MTDPSTSERSIFEAAIEMRSPAERAVYVNQACGSNQALRQEVEALLAAHDRLGSIASHAVASAATVAPPVLTEALGAVIGPYKLLQQIGEGGMGVVWMAEQTQPVQRKVALKVIKPGMDSRQVIARFEAERQALAMMDHVNIARVIDAGATESGRPYFVMELVHGVPITKYCDDNQLTPRERLELFVPVLQAIQHAHQKGIIHRDVKPSNVMITLYDGKPVPKVIDFGVAKATEQKLTERTLFTQYGTMVGTLEYMSPEQAEMSALGVDTRSDIYSLGVLLYELLTGSTPLSHKRVKEAAYAELLRMIKEEEPPRPSTRLSESGEALASISALRKTEPAKLSKLMRGELDWIVMKTLEKDRNRRYETANGFAADVQRYLNDEAVQACPPSAVYRCRKFARRNKAALTMVLLIAAALIGGALVSTWQAIRATNAEALAQTRLGETEEARKEAVANLKKAREAVDQMLTRVADDKLGDVPQMEPVRKALLEDALKFYQGFLQQKSADPALRLGTGRALERVGFIYHCFAQHNDAMSARRQSVALLEELAVDFSAEPEYRAALAESCLALGCELCWAFERHQEAEPFLRRAVVLAEKLVDETPEIPHRALLVQARRNLAYALASLGRARDAEQEYRSGLALAERLAGQFPNEPGYHELQAGILHLMGYMLVNTDPAEAEKVYRRALALRLMALAENPNSHVIRNNISWTQGNLASLLRQRGRLPEAEEACRQAIEFCQPIVADFPNRLNYRSCLCEYHLELGGLLEATNRPVEAERSYRLAWAVGTDKVGPKVQPPSYWFARLRECEGGLVKLLTAAGRMHEVEAHYRQAVSLWEKLARQSPSIVEYRRELARTYGVLAHLLTANKRPEEAKSVYAQLVPLLEETLAVNKSTLAADHAQVVAMRNELISIYQQLGRTAETFPLLEESLKLQSSRLGIDHAETIVARRRLAWAYQRGGRTEQAIALYREANHLGSNTAETYNNWAWILATCEDVKFRDPKRAVELAKKAVELAPRSEGRWNTLGVAQYRAGDFQGAIASLQKAGGFDSGGTAYDYLFLAMAHCKLNDKTQARTWFDKALAWMKKSPPNSISIAQDDELSRFETETRELLGIEVKAKLNKN